MNSERLGKAKVVIGPGGQTLTIDDLPSPETNRWVVLRKAEVVAAVRRGLIGRNEACDRYGISDEELLSWEQLIDAHGLRGLPTTRLQEYRKSERDDNPSTPVRDDNLLVDISTGERVAKKWSLRQTGLFVVTMSTVLWGVIIFVVWQMAY